MTMRWGAMLMGLAALGATVPAAAQFSDSYKFLKAVKDGDAKVLLESLDGPNTTIVNTRGDNNETALHIVVRRREASWLAYLLSKGAKPELRDGDGNTPLALASQLGFAEGIRTLARYGNVNTPNNRGETPLILAVHNRDIATSRLLLSLGANPALPDRIAGKSARDYAAEDKRAVAILKAIDETKAAAPPKQVAGPQL